MLTMSWIREFRSLAERGEPFVMVTVIEIIGSAPREVGARMLVTESAEYESIGGGKLEYTATHKARELLRGSVESEKDCEFHGLGVVMEQCCGGAVRLLYERYAVARARSLAEEMTNLRNMRINFLVSPIQGDEQSVVLNNKADWKELPGDVTVAAGKLLQRAVPDSRLTGSGSAQWFVTRLDELPTKVVVFGAGHVGKALIKLLGDLPFEIDWVDGRSGIFPQDVPVNVAIHARDDFSNVLSEQNPGTFYIVMTHSHGLDYEICLEILETRNFGWVGLIGSETKRKRFEKRFTEDGIDPFTLARLCCPIGLRTIKGKHPAVIAMSTAAQLLEARQRTLDAASSANLAGTAAMDSTVL